MGTYREWDEDETRRRGEGQGERRWEEGDPMRARREAEGSRAGWGPEGAGEWRRFEGSGGWRGPGRPGESRGGERGFEEWRGDAWRGGARRGYGARREREMGGLLDVEDRGPIDWLGERAHEAKRRGRGPKGYRRTDERVCDEVCERIARSGVDASDVEVKVENGEVTLTGTVPTRADKWWLEDLADDTYGVDDVHNHVRVARPGAEGAGPPGAARH